MGGTFKINWDFIRCRVRHINQPIFHGNPAAFPTGSIMNRCKRKTIKLLIGSNKESKLRSMRTSNWIGHKFITEETPINIARKGNSPRRIKKVVFFWPETVLQERRVTQTNIEGSNTEWMKLIKRFDSGVTMNSERRNWRFPPKTSTKGALLIVGKQRHLVQLRRTHHKILIPCDQIKH